MVSNKKKIGYSESLCVFKRKYLVNVKLGYRQKTIIFAKQKWALEEADMNSTPDSNYYAHFGFKVVFAYLNKDVKVLNVTVLN